VESAVKRNEYLFNPGRPRPPIHDNVYDHMMALHIRRGDYEEACTRLADYNSSFYGWNLLPQLPDPFVLPAEPFEMGHNTPTNIAEYLVRCLPTNQYLVYKVIESKKQWEGQQNGRKLDTMFIMTNADSKWIKNFSASLKSTGFTTVVTTHDLKFDDEQIGVNMAVDMEFGRKAAVFIGNGWSSMTSNILHRRLVDGKEPLANRFW